MTSTVEPADRRECLSPDQVRDLMSASGVTVAEWARQNGFSSGLVYQVLDGRRKCVRGQSFRIAVALGIRRGRPLDVTSLSELLAARAA